MKKLASILALLLLPVFALGQTGAYSGHSFVGGTPATTSGMKSSNYMYGIIPGASITVYLTGTTTKATIYADGSNTPLSNPFFSNLASGTNPGGFIFWSLQNQGLDIQAQGGMGNASCTISPLCYPTATTLQVDVYPNNSFSAGNPAAPFLSFQYNNNGSFGSTAFQYNGLTGAVSNLMQFGNAVPLSQQGTLPGYGNFGPIASAFLSNTYAAPMLYNQANMAVGIYDLFLDGGTQQNQDGLALKPGVTPLKIVSESHAKGSTNPLSITNL
ncbi:MAG: hypothetical protein WBW84_05135, partial [Acidobacteriaceae bacterium]